VERVDPSPDLETISDVLKAIANPVRMELLLALRSPRALAEIHLRPARKDGNLRPDRTMSRVSVKHHLESLLDIGVVRPLPGLRDGREVETYQINHRQLFALTEELRALTRLRGTGPDIPDGTIPAPARQAPGNRTGMRLTVLNGPTEGKVHTLPPQATWTLTVGRKLDAGVCLDHDPYISLLNTELVRDSDRVVVRDLPSSRNGTWLNWELIPRGSEARIATGDVIQVGRTQLLFHGQ